jgi:DNA repair exonuclease SbcCD ATPase subunit
MAEEKRQSKLISVLSAQRDIKARESARVEQKQKDARQHVRMKELIILDLTKRCNELSNRLKEFSALYEVVKNERNKYVNLIQSSAQALAEMREKIRILNNEVHSPPTLSLASLTAALQAEILRNESSSKDKALSKERTSHQNAQSQRDALRQEMNKLLAEYRQKQNIVEQQIQEIDKLNLVINNLEKQMLELKSHYEHAVEDRNVTGPCLS